MRSNLEDGPWFSSASCCENFLVGIWSSSLGFGGAWEAHGWSEQKYARGARWEGGRCCLQEQAIEFGGFAGIGWHSCENFGAKGRGLWSLSLLDLLEWKWQQVRLARNNTRPHVLPPKLLAEASKDQDDSQTLWVVDCVRFCCREYREWGKRTGLSPAPLARSIGGFDARLRWLRSRDVLIWEEEYRPPGNGQMGGDLSEYLGMRLYGGRQKLAWKHQVSKTTKCVFATKYRWHACEVVLAPASHQKDYYFACFGMRSVH